jgi:hypothetical protein
VIRNGRVKTFNTDLRERQSFLKFLAEVPLPVVGEIDLGRFARVYNEEIDAANTLKAMLRERFLELDIAKGSELPEAAILKVGIRLEREAKLAVNDIKRLCKKDTVQAAGVLLGTSVAILAALNVEMFSAAAPLISGAGGLAALYRLLDSHIDNRHKVQDNPFLFLWILKKHI